MDYSKKTKSELITLCKSYKIKGYSTKKKEELITLLETFKLDNNEEKELEKEEKEELKNEIMKPFLKWVGGKTQIINYVLNTFPNKINNYHEPFLGGGSVLFGLLSYIQSGKINLTGKIYASDINNNLITLYQHIQKNVEEFISEMKILIDDFNTINGNTVNRKPTCKEEAFTSQESYYYWIRSCYNKLVKENKESVIKSAMLLFLNKTCFRGVYREGPNGFNVPFGNYKNPSIIDENHIRNISNFIQPVIFTSQSFQASLKYVKSNDFVYLDPPYAPETNTSFVSYTADGFNLDTHNELFKKCHELTTQNIKFIMSNSDVMFVRSNFPVPYIIKKIECRRSINSKKPDSKTNEVLISN